MDHLQTQKEILRNIISSVNAPEDLSLHDWVQTYVVQEYAKGIAGDEQAIDDGVLLLRAIQNIYEGLMPSTPPVIGKRVFTKWGEFGILAARYFKPFAENEPAPSSLEDAWQNIDEAIGYFVEKKKMEESDDCSSSKVNGQNW